MENQSDPALSASPFTNDTQHDRPSEFVIERPGWLSTSFDVLAPGSTAQWSSIHIAPGHATSAIIIALQVRMSGPPLTIARRLSATKRLTKSEGLAGDKC